MLVFGLIGFIVLEFTVVGAIGGGVIGGIIGKF